MNNMTLNVKKELEQKEKEREEKIRENMKNEFLDCLKVDFFFHLSTQNSQKIWKFYMLLYKIHTTTPLLMYVCLYAIFSTYMHAKPYPFFRSLTININKCKQ